MVKAYKRDFNKRTFIYIPSHKICCTVDKDVMFYNYDIFENKDMKFKEISIHISLVKKLIETALINEQTTSIYEVGKNVKQKIDTFKDEYEKLFN